MPLLQRLRSSFSPIPLSREKVWRITECSFFFLFLLYLLCKTITNRLGIGWKTRRQNKEFPGVRRAQKCQSLLRGILLRFENGAIPINSMDGRSAGSVRYYNKGRVCIIERLSVAPALQGRGIGRGMITDIEKRMAGVAHKIYIGTGGLAFNLLMFYSNVVSREKPY